MSENLYLVTGSAGHIGGGVVAELLKTSGTIVYGFDFKALPGEQFEPAPGSELRQIIGNVMDEAALEDLWAQIAARDGELRGIVNCFYGPEAPLKLTKYSYQADPEIDMPGEKRQLAIIDAYTNYASSDFLSELNINLVGLHNVIRAFTPEILKSKSVSIVNLASAYGIKVPNQDLFTDRKKFVCKLPGYSASKAGVISFTEYLASIFSGRESTNLVRFNCVAPGNLYRNHNDEFVKNYKRYIWGSRMPGLDDVVPGIMFLLSDGARYINGTTLEIDSGWVRK